MKKKKVQCAIALLLSIFCFNVLLVIEDTQPDEVNYDAEDVVPCIYDGYTGEWD